MDINIIVLQFLCAFLTVMEFIVFGIGFYIGRNIDKSEDNHED
jgi:hypothetical protein